MEGMRIQIEISKEHAEELKVLMQKAGLNTYKDLFENSLALFDWAIQEVQSGRTIASVNEEENKYKEVTMPALRTALRTAHKDARPLAEAG